MFRVKSSTTSPRHASPTQLQVLGHQDRSEKQSESESVCFSFSLLCQLDIPDVLIRQWCLARLDTQNEKKYKFVISDLNEPTHLLRTRELYKKKDSDRLALDMLVKRQCLSIKRKNRTCPEQDR